MRYEASLGLFTIAVLCLVVFCIGWTSAERERHKRIMKNVSDLVDALPKCDVCGAHAVVIAWVDPHDGYRVDSKASQIAVCEQHDRSLGAGHVVSPWGKALAVVLGHLQ